MPTAQIIEFPKRLEPFDAGAREAERLAAIGDTFQSAYAYAVVAALGSPRPGIWLQGFRATFRAIEEKQQLGA